MGDLCLPLVCMKSFYIPDIGFILLDSYSELCFEKKMCLIYRKACDRDYAVGIKE